MSETVSTGLQKLLGPKPGMQPMAIPTESYQHPSVPLSAKRLVNLYVEAQPPDARSPLALVSTPGLALEANVFGVGPIIAMNADEPGMLYVLSGTNFYRLSLTILGAVLIEDLGFVGSLVPFGGAAFNYNQIATIAVGTTAVVVCVPPNAFTCRHTDAAINQIGVTFPASGASSVTYLDGYFVFTSYGGSAQFFVCLLLDPTMFDALDFANADGVPNSLTRAITLGGEVWLGGDSGWEVWYDSGGATFPLSRRQGSLVLKGIGAARTVALCDSSVFWLSTTGRVFRAGGPDIGYRAVRVSTHGVEEKIRTLGITSAVCAMSYAEAGHEFYIMTLGDVTLAYDCLSQKWADRSSSNDGSSRWIPSCCAQQNNNLVFGDSATGRTFGLQEGLNADDGVPIVRSAVFPPVFPRTNRGFMNRIEIEMQVGGVDSPGDVVLDWSDDGGVTFRAARRTLKAGLAADLKKRVYATRLGSFRQRVMRVQTLGHTTIYGAHADISDLLMGG